MHRPHRPIAFVLAASNHGTMIVNRHDYRMEGPDRGIGVGFQILNSSSFDQEEIGFVLALLHCRQRHFGHGVVAIDGGANIGVHTIEWARQMHDWGHVLSFEAQEMVYYALAGNIAINNCLNVNAFNKALGDKCGSISIPKLNYLKAASFGSLELRKNDNNEFIGQAISYELSDCVEIPIVTLDSLKLPRIDFVKLDVEGMELDVLKGSQEVISKFHPIFFMEIMKSDPIMLRDFMEERGYKVFPIGVNALAIHSADPCLQHIRMNGEQLHLVL